MQKGRLLLTYLCCETSVTWLRAKFVHVKFCLALWHRHNWTTCWSPSVCLFLLQLVPREFQVVLKRPIQFCSGPHKIHVSACATGWSLASKLCSMTRTCFNKGASIYGCFVRTALLRFLKYSSLILVDQVIQMRGYLTFSPSKCHSKLALSRFAIEIFLCVVVKHN